MPEQTALREALLHSAQQLNCSGLSPGKSGNASVRCGDGFLITPNGMDYASLQPEDLLLLDMRGERRQGRLKPSSEWRMHRDIYQHKADAAAIIHAHPTYSTALACAGRAIPAFHYMVSVAGGDSIPLAPYALFGSQALSDAVVQTLSARSACLLEHHGMIAHAATPAQALQLALEVENLAQQYCEVLKLGAARILSREQMDEVLQQFADYGQRF